MITKVKTKLQFPSIPLSEIKPFPSSPPKSIEETHKFCELCQSFIPKEGFDEHYKHCLESLSMDFD